MLISASPNSKRSNVINYIAYAKRFDKRDWAVYIAWCGLIWGLFSSLAALSWGVLKANSWNILEAPGYLPWLPLGAFIFAVSISIDTIGHRSEYKEAISQGEDLVHGMTILCGIGSCVLLSAAGPLGTLAAIPAAILTALSIIYSLIDEVFHWRRYTSGGSETTEMWSHLGILIGHSCLMTAWWMWYLDDYRGVREVLAMFGS